MAASGLQGKGLGMPLSSSGRIRQFVTICRWLESVSRHCRRRVPVMSVMGVEEASFR